MKFPDQGTTIATAIEQATGLFKAFNFLDASGNLMVLFSDGQDTQVTDPRQAVSGDRRRRGGRRRFPST